MVKITILQCPVCWVILPDLLEENDEIQCRNCGQVFKILRISEDLEKNTEKERIYDSKRDNNWSITSFYSN